MDAHVRAGIDIFGTSLRYAEVEQYGSRYRLLRLGSCDFDFDIAQELLYDRTPAHLQTLTDALADVYEGAVATSLRIALHPLGCTSFFTPLPEALAAPAGAERLQDEMALLVGAGPAGTMHLTTDPLYSEEVRQGQAVTWYHGLAVPGRLQAHFTEVVDGLPFRRHRFRLTMQCAAHVIAALQRNRPELAPPLDVYTLAVGWYDTHIEYSLSTGGQWYFGHHTMSVSPTDGAYFALALCSRLGITPDAIGTLYVYGKRLPEETFQPLEVIFRKRPERLNPLYVVDLDPESLDDNFDAEAYVPCIGAAL